MPYVNGEFSRSAGQGYARAKAMGHGTGEKQEDSPAIEGEGGSKGSVLHVKHHGGGKFSTKDDQGNVQKHESMDHLHAHMSSHFGLDGSEGQGGADETSSEYDMGDSGEALKSILG